MLKIASDKKHEELIHKWKRQLEQKSKAFETLRSQLAPPRDLDQLRMKIQEEVEKPYKQRMDGMRAEVGKYHELFNSARREYEILKAQVEQHTVDEVGGFNASFCIF